MSDNFKSVISGSCLLFFLVGCGITVDNNEITDTINEIKTNTLVSPAVSLVTTPVNPSSVPLPIAAPTPASVKNRQIKTINIFPVPTNIMSGAAINLKAEIVYTDKSTSKDIIWELDNNLATIDSQGLLKGIANGLIHITAKAKEKPDKSQSIYIRVWNSSSSSSSGWLPIFVSGGSGDRGVSSAVGTPTTPSSHFSQTSNLTAPTGLNSTDVVTTGLALTWPAVTGATSYKIYRDGVVYADNIITTSQMFTGLTAGTTYNFQISAVNATGESQKSTEITVTTLQVLTEGIQQWAFNTDNWIASSPALADDGTLYVGSDNGKLYAINPDGTQKWAFTTSGAIESSPLIGNDGTIYVGSDDRKFYAINPDGTQKWSVTTANIITSSPTMDNNGTIYVGSSDNKIYAINSDGTTKWTATTSAPITSSPAIGSDGTIYVGSSDNKIYAINPDGTIKWSYTTGGVIEKSSPAIGSDGTIYVGSEDNKLYALNPDGTLKWSFTTGGKIDSSPAIDTDGTIYVGSDDNKLYAINPDGTQKWAFATNSPINASSPTIGSDGLIYIGSSDGKFYAIKPNGTQKWAFTSGWSMGKSSATISSNKTIYIGGKKLYAINSSSSGHADSPWPKSNNKKKK